MSDPGIIWSVRYYGQDDASVQKILAAEIDRLLDQFEADGKDWTSTDLAAGLIQDMDMRPSGVAELAVTPERVQKALALLPDEVFEFDFADVVKLVLQADQEARQG